MNSVWKFVALIAFCCFSTISLAQIPKVDVIIPSSGKEYQALELTGSIEAIQNAKLAPLQAGLVQTLYVDQGDQVTKGQKLLALDDTLAKLTLSQLQAGVDASKANLVEKQRLVDEIVSLEEEKVIAQTTINERKAQLNIAQAQLAQAKAQLSQQKEVVARHVLYAPFNGVIAQRTANLGEWVSQQSAVFNLVELAQVRLKLAIPQEYFSMLNGHEKIEVTIFPDTPNAKPVNTYLSKLVASANPLTRTVTALVNVESNQLLPGMSARATVAIPVSGQDVVWLPKTAIKRHPDGGTSVFYLSGDKVNRSLVNVLHDKGNLVGVTGASPNNSYIASGVELLRDGDQVSINSTKGN